MDLFKKLTPLLVAPILIGVVATSAVAAGGGVSVGDDRSTGSVGTGSDSTGDRASVPSKTKGSGKGGGLTTSKKRRFKRKAPLLKLFKLQDSKGTRFSYKIEDSDKLVNVVVAIISNQGNKTVFKKKLGRQRTGVIHRYRISNLKLESGNYHIVLGARDPAGYKLKTKKIGRTASFDIASQLASGGHFPIVGQWSWSSSGGQFGAERPGRLHQGYDLLAPEGEKIVAPNSGYISFTDFQAKGAGYYVVLDGDDGYDYAFMHLKEGSTKVKKGDRVLGGQQLGEVGSTGYSFGSHLHFEIWQGAWQLGGKAIDPKPFLEQWAHAVNAKATISLTSAGGPAVDYY